MIFNSMPSAVIAVYEYDADTETLTICYHSVKIYNYMDVPEKVFREMRSTMVKGIWFNPHIKGKYRFVEVTPGVGEVRLSDGKK